MLKWIVTSIIAIFFLGLCTPLLTRTLRLGRLPGDVSIRYRGRVYVFPFTSTLLLSLLVFLISRLL